MEETKEFKFRLERKITVWEVDRFTITANSLEEARNIVLEKAETNLYHGMLEFEGESEILFDTMEFLPVEENYNNPTVEIYDKTTLIWDNLNGKK
jgi:hypothetical protein